jgi:hypothetical protein
VNLIAQSPSSSASSKNQNITNNSTPNTPDNLKKEIYEHIEKLYTRQIKNSENNFLLMEYILIGMALLFALFGGLNIYQSNKDRKFIEDFVKERISDYKEIFSERIKTIESMQNELEKKLESETETVSKLKKEIEDFSNEIEILRKDALWAKDSQTYYKKLFSKNPEEITTGLTKITESSYYSPLTHRKIKDLCSSTKNSSVKIAGLRALSVFGETNALKKLAKMAKNNKEAETTLKHLKEEFPEL